jgi:hypothetical protein
MKKTDYVPPHGGTAGPGFTPPNLGAEPPKPARKRKGKEGNGGADGGGKPVIQIVAGEVSRIVDQIEESVIAADLGLREAMCIAADFVKFDKRAGEWVDIDPPIQRA